MPELHGICHMDPTHPTHWDATGFLWDLVLDTDFIRTGKPSVTGAVTAERLARWPALREVVRRCWRVDATLRPGTENHDVELAFGDALVGVIAADLLTGRPPTLPPAVVAAFPQVRARLERCREDSIKY